MDGGEMHSAASISIIITMIGALCARLVWHIVAYMYRATLPVADSS